MCVLKIILISLFLHLYQYASANEPLGCGGFLQSHVSIDFSRVLVKLSTKEGILKEQTHCAPNSGYYFIPLYDRGDYVLELEPPPGWSFTPSRVPVTVDGETDLCSLGKDINFVFRGFGIAGKVASQGSSVGPSGVHIKLTSNDNEWNTITSENGVFSFTPVYPGKYEIIASHERWKFQRNKVSVIVKEANTELALGSLIISGYDVTGNVKVEEKPVPGIKMLLLALNKNLKFEAESDLKGIFTFPAIPPGKYKLITQSKAGIRFKATEQEFEVHHNSLKLETFDILGVTVKGFVKSNSKPLITLVRLDDEDPVKTKTDGSYEFYIQPGTHVIRVQNDDYMFDTHTFKFSLNDLQLKDITPSAFKVCGAVISDKISERSITINAMHSTMHKIVQSHPETGEFCDFLPKGKYQLQVNVDDDVMHFYPLMQIIEVNAPLTNIIFSQLKVTVHGEVKCLLKDDCKRLKIIMRPINTNEEIIANVIDGQYTISDIRPGEYRITLSSNQLCWDQIERNIHVSNASTSAPTFLNTGYAVTFVSSHETSAIYSKENTLTITQGVSRHCLPQPGSYKFELLSCHQYEHDVIDYSTSYELNEIVLTALKHRATIEIESEENLEDVFMQVDQDEVKSVIGPLKYAQGKYALHIYLQAGEKVSLAPQSDEVFFFSPSALDVIGLDDCTNFGVMFEAKRGKVFKGKVNPPLEGVKIQIDIQDSHEMLTTVTDSQGEYKFAPMEDLRDYKVSAQKDSYVIVGPDAGGNFEAKKLSQITVSVVDEASNEPLGGTLLSLSGMDSFRSNLKTNEDGSAIFPNLSPSEYFIKPMLKEYHFQPSSKTANMAVGEFVNIVFKGKRIAYSAYGKVITLNNRPEKQIPVVATGRENCSKIIEETVTDSLGNFRIRGLLPYCSYQINVRCTPENNIERVIPEQYNFNVHNKDVKNISMMVFYPSKNMDIFAKVYTSNADHYRHLRLKIICESPSMVVHNLKVDLYHTNFDHNVGVMLLVPTLLMDGKVYSLQLISASNAIKGTSTPKMVTANNSYKYVELDFVSKTVVEQQIKRVSNLTLCLIFIAAIAAFNYRIILQHFHSNFNNISASFVKKTAVPQEHKYIDNVEIEKIVETINVPKKKVKTK